MAKTKSKLPRSANLQMNNASLRQASSIIAIFGISMSVVSVVVYSIILNYVNKLEKESCDCSIDWRRTFIKSYSMIVIGLSISSFVVLLVGRDNILKLNSSLLIVFMTAIMLVDMLSIVYLYASLSFIYKMNKIDCKCSENWKRTFMMVLAVVAVISRVVNLVSLAFKK